MTGPYRERAHQLMREAVLDAAAEEVVARGWRGLQMSAIAEAAQVSRATLYKAFGDKHQLSEALVLRHVERLLDAITADMAGQPLREQWRLAALGTLRAATADPLVKAVLLSDSSDEFLPLLTTRGAPVLDLSVERLTAAVTGEHPSLDPADVRSVADAMTRLVLSHLVLPRGSLDQVADQVADLAARFLDHLRTPST